MHPLPRSEAPMTTLEDIQPAFLTLPESGDRTYRTLLRKVRLLGLRHLLELSGDGPFRPLHTVVQHAARRNSRALLQVIGLHDILTPLLCHRAGLCSTELLVREFVPALVVALSRAGLVQESLLWAHPFPRLLDPTRGLVISHPAGALEGVVAHPDGVEVRHHTDYTRLDQVQAPFERATRRYAIAPGLHLSLVDTNPLAMVEAHPDKQGNALSRTDARCLDQGFSGRRRVLKDHLPEWTRALPGAPARHSRWFEPEPPLSLVPRGPRGGLHEPALHAPLAEALVHEAPQDSR